MSVAQQHLHAIRISLHEDLDGEVEDQLLKRMGELRRNRRGQLVIAIDTDIHDKLEKALNESYPMKSRILFVVIITVTALLSVMGALYLMYCCYRDSWVGRFVQSFNRLTEWSQRSHDEGYELWDELLRLMQNPTDWAAYINSVNLHNKDQLRRCAIGSKLDQLKRRLRRYTEEGQRELQMESLEDLLRMKFIGVPYRCCCEEEVSEGYSQTHIYEEISPGFEKRNLNQENAIYPPRLNMRSHTSFMEEIGPEQENCFSPTTARYELNECSRSGCEAFHCLEGESMQ